VRKIVARTERQAGIEFPIHPHMLRQATSYKLAYDGQDTRAIQQYLGHRSIQHTTRYTDLAPSRFRGNNTSEKEGFPAGLTLINPPVAVRTALLRGSNSAIRLILKEIRNFRGLGLQPQKGCAQEAGGTQFSYGLLRHGDAA